MLSLGGWGGCETCSYVFSQDDFRREFAASVNEISGYFHTDGLDLDWEYPVVSGYPGHAHAIDDREAFTKLLQEIRNTCGANFELSFAAGGFTSYIDSSIEWKEVVKYTDFINIMSYDLVHGFSKESGHHTPLYSTASQIESTDHAVSLLIQKGVPAEKLVIGSAFYGRVFKVDEHHPAGLYQPCVFQYTFQFKNAEKELSALNGYERYYDDTAKASYAVNKSSNLIATFDDEKSVVAKTRYAINRRLGGIMFWQLCDDKVKGGLLNAIYQTISSDK
jgi:chitinase